MSLRLHHVNVVVPPGATDSVVAFYVDVLGMQRLSKPAGTAAAGAWLAVDGRTQVHLSERDGAAHPDSHFALVTDDYDEVRAKLEQAGSSFTEQAEVFGGRRGFTRDPVGNRVEILEAAGDLA